LYISGKRFWAEPVQAPPFPFALEFSATLVFAMNYENIRVEKRAPLATITLDRPKVLNALNAATFAELDSAIDELGVDAEVRVVLLMGAGERAFAAGADIRELAGRRTIFLTAWAGCLQKD
jgi:enoyl-CoA hydratase/carnithine racemase